MYVCPSCFQPVEECKPSAYPNHDKQLWLRIESPDDLPQHAKRKCRIDSKEIGEGRSKRVKDTYFMRAYECTTDGCKMRGAIHESLLAESKEVS